MRKIRSFTAASLLAVATAAGAAPGPAVALDGSASAAASKSPVRATKARHPSGKASAPSSKADAVDLKAAAAADIARRDGIAKKPRLKLSRENLKGAEAKRALAQRQKPSTYDRDISQGDKDHTEQVTNLKITGKK